MKKLWTAMVMAAAVLMAADAHAAEARITGTLGETYLISQQGVARAKPGMTAVAGDMLMTRKAAAMDVVVNGMAGCRLLAGTSAVIAGVNDQRIRLLVAEGDAIFNVKKMAEGMEFTVDTPTAVASVRGTQFWGRVAGEDQATTTFAVKEGSIRVTQKETGQTVNLTAGQAVDLGPGAVPVQVRSAAPVEMEAMKLADDLASRM